MKLPKKTFDEKLNEYIGHRFIPSIKSPLKRYVLDTALGSNRISIGMFGDKWPTALGFMDAEGNVDTEAIRSAMAYAMRKAEDDLHIEILGLHFHQTDIDKLFAFFDAIPQPQPQPPKEG